MRHAPWGCDVCCQAKKEGSLKTAEVTEMTRLSSMQLLSQVRRKLLPLECGSRAPAFFVRSMAGALPNFIQQCGKFIPDSIGTSQL
jgi:hypothetical protein